MTAATLEAAKAPDDIDLTAGNIADLICMAFPTLLSGERAVISGERDVFLAVTKQYIARAILAERERCAGVAANLPIAELDKTNSPSHELSFAVGAMAQRDFIAKQIRGEA